MASSNKPRTITNLLKPLDSASNGGVASVSNVYLDYYDDSATNGRVQNEHRRKKEAMSVSNAYYDLATDFYEYGWGESFHFAVMNSGESREHSFAKHEYYLALKMQLRKGQRVLDVGCGIGGPGRHIASFSGAHVVGINCNDYQLKRAAILTEKAGLSDYCSFVKGDFNQMPFEDNSFDAVYAIEATCHSVDRTRVFSEIRRVLKPGGIFATYEWIMTEKYDESNENHRKIKDDILVGTGLSDMIGCTGVLAATRASGLEVVEAWDRAVESPVPWYTVLQPQWTLSDLKITPMGRWLTHALLYWFESVRFAPKGSVAVHRALCKGADGLVAAGVAGIFTPMYTIIARKPVSAGATAAAAGDVKIS